MNRLEQLGRLAGTLAPGGARGALEYVAVAALVVSGAAVLACGIVRAHRTRRRNGRQAPGPPPGRVPAQRTDGELRAAEAQAFAGLVRPLRNEVKAHTVARRRRTVRRTRQRAAGKR